MEVPLDLKSGTSRLAMRVAYVSAYRASAPRYCTQIVVSGETAVPTISCNGAAPEGRYGPGTIRFTCSSPTSPGALPAQTICAGMPLTVALTGSCGRGYGALAAWPEMFAPSVRPEPVA